MINGTVFTFMSRLHLPKKDRKLVLENVIGSPLEIKDRYDRKSIANVLFGPSEDFPLMLGYFSPN